MFRQLAALVDILPATSPSTVPIAEQRADLLFNQHPSALAALLEDTWDRRWRNNAALGRPDNRSVLDVLNSIGQVMQPPVGVTIQQSPPEILWDHLIYAYMIENTRVYEIFRRLLHELLHGEKLGTPTRESVAWLRTTEALFYRDSAPFFITDLSTHIRPDARAGRRNAYQRMFGMDLNHGSDDGKPYPYVRAEAANGEFVNTFEELLREVWVGMTYVSATSSSNPTDDSKLSELAEKLNNMLLTRRQNGNLSREEFAYVSMMSWFHLTLEYPSPIVRSLRAEGTGAEQQLFKIAERVGLPAHGMSKNFFDIADPLSRILIQIELGTYNRGTAVAALYTPATGGPESDMRTIITHWTAITGRDVKARKVAAN
jgi:hypothetical protein